MENLPYLVAAYATIATVLLTYAIRLWRRQKALQRQCEDLGTPLKRTEPNPVGPFSVRADVGVDTAFWTMLYFSHIIATPKPSTSRYG